MNRKKIVSLLLAAALAVGLTACGSTAVSTPTQSQAAASTQEPSAPVEPVDEAKNETAAEDEAEPENAAENEAGNQPGQNPPPPSTQAPVTASEPTAGQSKEPVQSDASKTPTTESGKVLVVYFTRAENIEVDSDVDAVASASINLDGEVAQGNLQILAGMVAEASGGDVFSIHTVEKYPTAYRATTDLANTEQSQNARPALENHVEDMEQYDTIYLGYPNWWGGLPMPVCTFLEEYDFSGKIIIPFASHEGSSLGSGPSEIAELCPDATVLDGHAVRGGSVKNARQEIADWVSSLEIDE